MKIADLFIDIVVGGAPKALSSVTSISSALLGAVGAAGSFTLGIGGMLAGLERLTAKSSRLGMDLHKFGISTGYSTTKLQEWQQMAGKFDVSADEMAGTIRGVRDAIAEMRLGGGQPKALGLIGIDPKRLEDTDYVIERLIDFSKRASAPISSNLLKSFGIDNNVFQMFRAIDLAKERANLDKSLIIQPATTKRLADIHGQWNKLSFLIDRMGADFISKNGFQLVEGISKIAKEVFSLVTALSKLAEQMKLLKWLGKVFEGWTMIINGVTKGVEKLTEASNDDKKKGALISDVKDFFSEVPSVLKEAYRDIVPQKQMSPIQGANSQTTNQNNTFYIEGSNSSPKEISDEISRMLSNAGRQIPAVRGNY